MSIQRQWTDTGHREKVQPGIDQIPEFDPRTGDHLWVVCVAYRVDPKQFTSADPSVLPVLDHENRLTITAPGCYYCEELYSPRLATRRCRGD